MENHYQTKHPRGSSPPPAQNERDVYGNETCEPIFERNRVNAQTNSPATSPPVASGPGTPQGDDGRWQDDGGEGG